MSEHLCAPLLEGCKSLCPVTLNQSLTRGKTGFSCMVEEYV